MYKILIADDEGIVRDSLKFIIERDFAGCEVYLARNGRQAIEIAEEQRPDIAVLDIQMPGISGISALREIKQGNPKVRALILTAYDNFDYAQQALSLGAEDYIMKPIDRKRIDAALMKIMHEIDEDREKRQDDLAIRERMEAVVPIIENGFVMSLIIQNEYNYSGDQYRRLLDFAEDYGYILVLEWGEDFRSAVPGNPVGSSVRARKFSIRMGEQIRVYFRAFLSDIMGNKVVAAIPWPREEMNYGERLSIIERVRSLDGSLKEITGQDFRAGIGSVKPWEDMYESYQDALNALRHGVRSVTHIDDLIARSEDAQQEDGMKKALLDAVRQGNALDAVREADAWTKWRVDCGMRDVSACKVEMLELLMEVRHLVEEQGKAARTRVETDLLRADDIEEMRRIVRGGVEGLTREIVRERPGEHGVIARATEYMRENYQKDISLDSVAEYVNVSPYYFSRLFKEGTGTNFTDYLTTLRIERARELLADPERSIKEIAIETGYSNANYFSRIFKKWTGMTPSELREQQGQGGNSEA